MLKLGRECSDYIKVISGCYLESKLQETVVAERDHFRKLLKTSQEMKIFQTREEVVEMGKEHRIYCGDMTGCAQSRCGGKEMAGSRMTLATIWVDGGDVS